MLNIVEIWQIISVSESELESIIALFLLQNAAVLAWNRFRVVMNFHRLWCCVLRILLTFGDTKFPNSLTCDVIYIPPQAAV